MTKLPKVYDRRPSLGCDPEFFFMRDGQAIGAEKVLPKNGLGSSSKVIIDGVQAELNPQPNSCRALLATSIEGCFRTLRDNLAKDVTVNFGCTIEISKENLDALSDASRRFGCAPSSTAHEGKVGVKIDSVDPSEYRTRAAGGHLHFGHYEEGHIKRALTKDHIKTVHMLDIICGNTCVLIDRDPSNAERRKLYGRAGEFRLPKHGLEYRTLSNFWLQSYPLMSIAMGLGRLAVQLIADPNNNKEYYEAFMAAVNMDDVIEAINTNNYKLALKNFNAIKPLLNEVSLEHSDGFPISSLTMDAFDYFHATVNEKGLSHFFKTDPMSHWVNGEWRNGHLNGGRVFLISLAATIKEEKTKKVEATIIKPAATTKGIEITYADEPSAPQQTRYRVATSEPVAVGATVRARKAPVKRKRATA